MRPTPPSPARRWASVVLTIGVGAAPLVFAPGAAAVTPAPTAAASDTDWDDTDWDDADGDDDADLDDADGDDDADDDDEGSSRAAVLDTDWGDDEADDEAKDVFGDYDAKEDYGSLYTVTDAIGARDVWRDEDASGRAITGSGVTVAVLDSGVEAVRGLDGDGKVVQGPDLSLEAEAEQSLPDDTYGHGTHMAGIIAAKDPVRTDRKTGAPKGSPETQLGVAPDARLLALKLATADGSTDVSQVIAALDWVVEHRDDKGMNVRVVNLAFGTDSEQDYQIDPLAAAAENAWRHGLVVVVSGGNDGADATRLNNPAIDPYVIAVGGADPGGKPSGYKRPVAADFSSRGSAERHVDLLAPGRSVAGLRAPGSFIDRQHPEGLVEGDPTGRLFRGSGTSQAAAVVSGAAALLLQAHPDLTPDQVKAALMASAKGSKRLDPLAGGVGRLDVHEAIELVDDAKKRVAKGRSPAGTVLAARQTFPVATGTGSLDAARGTTHLRDPLTGDPLAGEVDVFGVPWDGAAWFERASNKRSWDGGTWNRARWSGDRWQGNGWQRARWSGEDWQRARWSGDGWKRARWSGGDWKRARWSSGAWH